MRNIQYCHDSKRKYIFLNINRKTITEWEWKFEENFGVTIIFSSLLAVELDTSNTIVSEIKNYKWNIKMK